MNAIEAAQAAGWWHIFNNHWIATDLEAVAAGYYPIMWIGGARDLCLGHGIDFID